jgi:exopolyphosphatase/pppGpp-phosphohydrolase
LILGAVEISSRSTRLSVVDVTPGESERIAERCHSITAKLDNSERLTALVMAEVEIARDLGAESIEVVADQTLRGSRLIRLIERVSRAIGTGGIRIPAERESVAAAFVGATLPRRAELEDPVAVALIGEAAIGVGAGTAGLNPTWVGSRPAGAETISRKARFSNPPRPNQVEAAISGASRKIESLAPPVTAGLLVASDFSPVIERLCGSSITHDDARRGLSAILGQTNDDLAAWFGLEPGRSRFLTGTLVGIAALADAFGLPVEPVQYDSVAGRYWSDEYSRPVAGGRS